VKALSSNPKTARKMEKRRGEERRNLEKEVED
jgi:hypothetical protein